MADSIDKILVPVVDGIIAFVGGSPPVRSDRGGVIKLRWPGVTAKISVVTNGSHKMVEIAVEGVTKPVSFSGSTVSQSVRCAGMSIQRRLSKAAARPSDTPDRVQIREARQTAIAIVAFDYPEVTDGEGLPSTSFLGPIALYFNTTGTVDVALARLSNLSPERAGKIARAIHDLLADVVGDTVEIEIAQGDVHA